MGKSGRLHITCFFPIASGIVTTLRHFTKQDVDLVDFSEVGRFRAWRSQHGKQDFSVWCNRAGDTIKLRTDWSSPAAISCYVGPAWREVEMLPVDPRSRGPRKLVVTARG